MKAIVYESFGAPEVLALQEIARPAVGPDEVLVRVHAASPNPWDWHFMRGLPYIARLAEAGLFAPTHPVLGRDVAGRVEEVGARVTRFRPGDAVFGLVEAGGFAEYVSAPETLLAHKPPSVSFEQAATVPLAASTALQGLRDAGGIQPGQKVLIVGASGGVGTFAVQLARWLGAEVTGVCSTRNVELVRSIGAEHVIDYTHEDFTQSSARYDLIFQLAGTTSATAFRRILTPKGTLVLSSGDDSGRWIGPFGRVIGAVLLSAFVDQTMRLLTTVPRSDDLQLLSELMESGVIAPVIDRTYPLDQTAEAIRYLETGRARGKVVVRVSPDALATGRPAHRSSALAEAAAR